MSRQKPELRFPDTVPPEHMPWSNEIEALMAWVLLARDDAAFGKQPNVPNHLRPYLSLFAERVAPGSVAQVLEAFCHHVHRLTITAPSPAELLHAPSIDRWCAIRLADETILLIGRVHGHPQLRDGARARTSPLIRFAPANGWARTWSRHYRLGRPDPGFFLELQRDDRLPAGAEIDWTVMAPLSRH